MSERPIDAKHSADDYLKLRWLVSEPEKDL